MLADRVPEVSENTGEIDELPVFWRSAPADGTPALYLHGVPTNSDDWLPFLALGGGLAPDLPGFGRSGKPGNFDFTIEGYADFLEAYLDLVGVERVRLVVHDWGVVGLAFAQRHPERVERLVVVNAVPLLPGYEWHRAAQIWRRRWLLVDINNFRLAGIPITYRRVPVFLLSDALALLNICLRDACCR